MTQRWLSAWALGSVAFGGASLLVPLHVVLLGGSAVDLGLLAATAALVGAPGAVVFGRLADRITHRRPLVVGTLGIVALTLAAMPLLQAVPVVIAVNAALWLVVGAVAPVLTMLVVDDAPQAAWTERIGQLNAYQGYGWAGGLVLGAAWPMFVGQLGAGVDPTRTLFWALAGCAVASALGAAILLPRPSPDAHVSSDREIRRVARLVAGTNRGIRAATFAFAPNRLYWTTRGFDPGRFRARLDPALARYLFAAGLFFAGFAAFWAPLPLFLSTVGFSGGEIFALYLASSLSSAVLYASVDELAARYDVRLLQSGALTVRGLLFPGVAVAGGLGTTWLAFGLAAAALVAVGATWAVVAVVGTSIVTRLSPPGGRGEVLGVHTALAAVGGGAGGLLGGWLATRGYVTAFAVAGGLVVTGALLVRSIRTLSPVAADRPGLEPLDGAAVEAAEELGSEK